MAQPTRTVAVIAVHGVADQAPCATAREIADLLIRVDSAAGPFHEQGVRIEVDPVEVPPLDRATLWAQGADFTFMYGQLTGDLDCTGETRVAPLPKETYDSVRLSRSASAGTPALHVYEMYWADLSRLSTSFRQIFGEFYQLLFHVSSLGRHIVDEARDAPDAPDHDKWIFLSRAQAAAAHVLTLPIPILNLLLLALAASIGALWLPAGLQHVIGAGAIAIAVAAVFGLDFYRHFSRAHYADAIVIATALAAVTFVWVRAADTGTTVSAAYVAAWFLAVSAALFAIAGAYERRRPGARHWMLCLWLATSVLVVICSTRQANATSVLLMTIELLSYALITAWVALLLCHWWAALAGARVKWSARRAQHRARATPYENEAARYRDKVERVVWTGRLAVVMPTALFLVVTFALWAGLIYIADKLKPAATPALAYFPWHPSLYAGYKGWAYDQLSALGFDLMATAATPTAALSLVLMSVGTVLAIWAFVPSVVAEIKPPHDASDPRRLGDWLDNGFKLLRWSGRFFFLAVVVVLPLGVAVEILDTLNVHFAETVLALLDPERYGLPTPLRIVVTAGGVLAGTAVALVGFRSRLADVATRIRPVLDVALDVDNHLREHPLGANPRAKIAARFASLLRHVCEWRDPEGNRYDSLVIVAHSQGTVITADLLRFIRNVDVLSGGAADPRLARIGAGAAAGDALPMQLLTVGSPLRQLYGLRFPDLYEWARHSETGPWDEPATAPPIAHGPDPAELNVKRWVNAYRSGDYVGRYLWRPELCGYRWERNTRSESGTQDRVELCIGSGAHTHYFDHTAALVGDELRRLVR